MNGFIIKGNGEDQLREVWNVLGLCSLSGHLRFFKSSHGTICCLMKLRRGELGDRSPPGVPIWPHDLGRSHPLSGPQCLHLPNGKQTSVLPGDVGG